MPSYHRLGELPPKRHTQLRAASGELYAEEVIGTEGFSGCYSILYHRGLPPQVRHVAHDHSVAPQRWTPDEHRNRHLRTARLEVSGDPISARVPLLFNDDLMVSLAVVSEASGSFYKNLSRDELLFVHEGEGTLATQFGALPFRAGDYLYVPRGAIQQLRMNDNRGRLLVIEANGAIEIPHRYRNPAGQLREDAPYFERDFRAPERLDTHDETGEGTFEVQVKVEDELWCHHLDQHPFDVVGWDGYLYPFAFSIHDFEPIAGRIHVPPTAHQTFEGPQFVVCSFVPRLLDWDPQAVPIPYYHANVDSDEVLYYVSGEYAARKVERGSLTVHPRGMPHGPSAGAVEAALQRPRQTEEYAVMIDTFRPLHLAEACAAVDDPEYLRSWDRA
jgi:homogentisate 1,2-dioxygenase